VGSGTVQIDVAPGGTEDVDAFLLGSRAPDSLSLGNGDWLLVDFSQAEWFVVQTDDIPDFSIPDNPLFVGIHFYLQIGLYNPVMFPGDPLKTSNGLEVVIGTSTLTSYGTASGITLWSTTPPLLDTDFTVEFVIW
jgi:hypothetical protein